MDCTITTHYRREGETQMSNRRSYHCEPSPAHIGIWRARQRPRTGDGRGDNISRMA